jgi:serine protease Do
MKKISLLSVMIFCLLSTISCNFIEQTTNVVGTHTLTEEVVYVTVKYFVNNIQVAHYDLRQGHKILNTNNPPAKNYKTFVGWYTANGIKFDFSKPIMVSVSLYAKYLIDYPALTNAISTVSIRANVKIQNKSYNTGFLGFETTSITKSGSGVIIHDQSGNYYILTNNHVVAKETGYSYQSFTVSDYLGNTYTGHLYPDTARADYDLAVIYIAKGNDELETLSIESKNPAIGEDVIAIGQPQGQTNTITFGTITAYQIPNINASTTITNISFKIIKHSAPISSGSSGGVLLNTDLNIVGINFAGNNGKEDFSDYGLAIPAEKIKEYLHLYLYS